MKIDFEGLRVEPAGMNRKRHTLVKRRITTAWLACACVMLATTCAPRPPHVVPFSKLTPPPAAQSAAPAIGAARQNSAQADLAAARARASVALAKASVAEANAAAAAAVAEADRLRKQKCVTENDLVVLYNQMVAQEQRMKALTTYVLDTEDALAKEQVLRKLVHAKLVESEKLITARDSENDELRRLLEYSQQVADKATRTAQAAADSSDRLIKQVGIEEGRAKTWRWIAAGLGVLLLLALAAHVLRSYMRI